MIPPVVHNRAVHRRRRRTSSGSARRVSTPIRPANGMSPDACTPLMVPACPIGRAATNDRHVACSAYGPSGSAAYPRAAGADARPASPSRPSRPRRGPRGAGHLLAEGVHPVDDALPRQVRLLHLRQGAGPPRVSVPDPRRGARHRPAWRRGRLPRSPVHPRASAPRTATRWPATGWTPTVMARPSTTWQPCASWCSTRPGCCPTPTPVPFFPTSWPGCGPSAPARA